MSQPSSPEKPYSWSVPLLVSVAVHVALIVPVLFLASVPSVDVQDGMIVDTVALADQSGISITLHQASNQLTTPDVDPGSALPPMPSMPAANSAGLITTSSSGVSRARNGEEQEAPAARQSAAGSAGQLERGKETTSFFNIETQARSIVYVLDRSASMGLDGSFDAARRELCASLDQLPETVRFQIIAYNRNAEPLRIAGKADLIAATPDNKRQAILLLGGLYTEGGTDHLRALRRALALQPEVIFFFSDADGLKAEQVRAVGLLNHGKSIIHTIEVNGSKRGRGTDALEALATQNGGVHRFFMFAR